MVDRSVASEETNVCKAAIPHINLTSALSWRPGKQIPWFSITLTFLLALFFTVLMSQQSDAQRPIERNMIVNPLADSGAETGDELVYFNSYAGWARFGNYAISNDFNHLWQHELGGYLELFRNRDQSSLIFTTQIEFIADRHNEINFNPRAIFWEEGLMYTRRIGDAYLRFGYYHRCKHDIDNLAWQEQRSLVFGSAVVGLEMPVSLPRNGRGSIYLQYDQYTYTWEGRKPEETANLHPRWDDLFSSIRSNIHGQWPLSNDRLEFFAKGYGMVSPHSSHPIVNGGGALGLEVQGNAGVFRIAVEVEHLGDTGIPAQPTASTLGAITVQASTPRVFR